MQFRSPGKPGARKGTVIDRKKAGRALVEARCCTGSDRPRPQARALGHPRRVLAPRPAQAALAGRRLHWRRHPACTPLRHGHGLQRRARPHGPGRTPEARQRQSQARARTERATASALLLCNAELAPRQDTPNCFGDRLLNMQLCHAERPGAKKARLSLFPWSRRRAGSSLGPLVLAAA